MLHNTLKIFLFVFAFVFILSSCQNNDDEPAPPLEAQTVTDLAADPPTSVNSQGRPVGTGKYTFYSLKDNQVIENTDSLTNKWDIAFNSTTIIINGGAVRTGEGGAYIFTGFFDELTEIPEGQEFATDNSETDLAIPTGSGTGWYNYNRSTNVVSPIPGRVLVIRTAEGNYAKVEILSYYKSAPAEPNGFTDESRYYTFKFIYQPNGTKKF